MVQGGECVSIKKGANVVRQYFDQDYCILTIFVTDDFIKNVIEKHNPKIICGDPEKRCDSVIRLEIDEVLKTYFQSVLAYFPLPDPPPANLLKFKFEELIIYLLSNQKNPVLTGYFTAIRFEERDMVKLHGEEYRNYQKEFSQIIPMPPKKESYELKEDYSS